MKNKEFCLSDCMEREQKKMQDKHEELLKQEKEFCLSDEIEELDEMYDMGDLVYTALVKEKIKKAVELEDELLELLFLGRLSNKEFCDKRKEIFGEKLIK